MEPEATTIGALLLGLIPFAGYVFWRFLTGTSRADSEATRIYQTLNGALKSQVDQLEENLKSTHERLDEMEVKLAKAVGDIAFYDRIFKTALLEYFEHHPELADKYRPRRRASDK